MKGLARILTPSVVDVLLGDPSAPPSMQEILCATGACRAHELHAEGCIAPWTLDEIHHARKNLALTEAAEALRIKLAQARRAR